MVNNTMSTLENIKKIKSIYWLFVLFLINILIGWPGILSSDSQGQYLSALNGNYGDHHPAIMSFVWKYIDMIISGSGLLWAMHLSFLYGGFYHLCKIFPKKKWIPLMLILPHIFLYALMVWKDVGFALGYVYCICAISSHYVEGKKIGVLSSIFIFMILFYSTSIKFQGQYLSPFVILFYMITQFKNKKIIQASSSILAILLFFTALSLANNTLVPEKNKSHSWQYVKIYDIAGIAYVKKDTNLLPEFIKTKNYSDEKFYKIFNHKSVDDTVFPEDSIFKIFKGDYNRNKLLYYWNDLLISHPFSYLNHRLKNFSYCIFSRMGYQHVDNFMNASIKPYLDNYPKIYEFLNKIIGFLGYIFLSQIVVFILSLFSIIFLTFNLIIKKTNKYFAPAFFLNFTGILLCSIILFKSMAGTPRYTYIMVCLFYSSIPFLIEYVKKRNLIK